MKAMTLEDLTKDELLRVIRSKLLFGMGPSEIAYIRWASLTKKSERLWKEYEAMPGYSAGKTHVDGLKLLHAKEAKWIELERCWALAQRIYDALVCPSTETSNGDDGEAARQCDGETMRGGDV